MITDQTIISARTEMRNNAVKDRRLMRRMIAASIAAALTVPTVAAWGMDSPHVRQPSDRTSIALPPVPHIEAIPWMKWDANANAFKTDLLLSPTLQWGIGQTFEPEAKQKLSEK